MLSNIGLNALSISMKYGCLYNVVPYKWDPNKFQFSLHTGSWNLWVHRFHSLCMFVMGIVCITRLIRLFGVEDFPASIRAIHVGFALGYVLTNILYLQFHLEKEAIMTFSNHLLKYIMKSRKELNLGQGTGKYGWEQGELSGFVIVAAIMLFINPPAHAVAIITNPCCPSFVSSLYFTCRTVTENDSSFLHKIPFIFIENMIVANFFFIWSFNWFIIFLGLGWIRQELRILRTMVREFREEVINRAVSESFEQKYRELQCIMMMLNSAFKLYLESFPSLLLAIVGFYLFATIRYWDGIPVLTYMNFPACSLMCFFESMTPLGMAGQVNVESAEVLAEWKKMTDTDSDTNPDPEDKKKYRKGLRGFQGSCPNIRCTAGSMYTFENSIVATTMDNTIQLTCNLLVIYK